MVLEVIKVPAGVIVSRDAVLVRNRSDLKGPVPFLVG